MNFIGNSHERINLLFVDDMSKCCRIVMAGLSSKYSLHWINDRDEALKQIEKNNYDEFFTK